MDISIRYNWSDKKDWEYKELFDESVIGKKGWYKNWITYSIIIYSTDNLLEGYKKSINLSAQTILDQTLLEKMHPVSQENILLRTEERKFASSSKSAVSEIASKVEAEIVEQLSKKSKRKNKEQTNIFKIEQQVFDLDVKNEIKLSSEAMQELINGLNMSIRKATEEIGIAHTTLSRYLRKENKRQNNKNDEKMLNWLKEKTLTNV